VRESAKVFDCAIKQSKQPLSNREDIFNEAQTAVEKLIDSYFDIDDVERMIVADTVNILIPSFRPSRTKFDVPTLRQSTESSRQGFLRRLCATLNAWAQEYRVHGKVIADSSIGVGMVVLEKTRREEKPTQLSATDGELLKAIDNLQRIAAKGHGTFELVRGLKVFHKNLLYITKPLGQRFWTSTAALNDADEIAATILTRLVREGA
jgi:hypothetical protein